MQCGAERMCLRPKRMHQFVWLYCTHNGQLNNSLLESGVDTTHKAPLLRV